MRKLAKMIELYCFIVREWKSFGRLWIFGILWDIVLLNKFLRVFFFCTQIKVQVFSRVYSAKIPFT